MNRPRSTRALGAWGASLVVCLALAAVAGPGAARAAEAPKETDADLQFEFAEKLFSIRMYKTAAAEYARFLKDYGAEPRREEARFKLALSCAKQGGLKDYENALAELAALRKEFPAGKRLQDALFHSGHIRYLQGDAKGALADLSQLAKLDVRPDLSAALNHFLGRAYYDVAQYPDAIRHLSLVAKEPVKCDLRPFALTVLADAYARTGDMKGSAGALDTLLKDYPELPTRDEMHLRLGDARLALKEYNESLAAYSKVTPKGAAGDQAAVGRARALLGLKKYADAIKTCSDLAGAFRETPETRDLHIAEQCSYVIGLAHFEERRYSEAADSFSKCLATVQQGPMAEDAAHKLCWCCYHLGEKSAKKLVESTTEFRRRFPASGWTAQVIFLAGEGCLRLGDYANAVEQYRQIGEKDAHYADALYRIAHALHTQGKVPEAAAAYDAFAAAFGKHEKTGSALANGAALYQTDGKYKEAVDRCNRYLAEFTGGPETEEVVYQRAVCLGKLSQFEEMAAALTEYTQKYPRGAHAGAAFYWVGRHFRVRGDALAEKADPTGAAKEYDRALASFRSSVASGGPDRDAAVLALAECSYNLGQNLADRSRAAAARARGAPEPQKKQLEQEAEQLGKESAALHAQAASGFLELITGTSAIPTAEPVYFWTGAYLREHGDAKSAVRVFEAFLQKFKGSAQADAALYQLALLSGEIAPPDQGASIRYCDALLSSYPGSRFALQAKFAKARALEQSGQLPAAETLYTEVSQRGAGSLKVGAVIRLGHAAIAKKDYAAASRYFAEIGLLYDDKDFTPEALYFGGKANALLGEADEGVKLWQQVIARFSESKWAGEVRKDVGALGYEIGSDGVIRKK